LSGTQFGWNLLRREILLVRLASVLPHEFPTCLVLLLEKYSTSGIENYQMPGNLPTAKPGRSAKLLAIRKVAPNLWGICRRQLRFRRGFKRSNDRND
jgi:hypothetical protein